VHFVKILQYLLSLLFHQVRRPNSRIWWKLEELDLKLYKLPTGLHLSIIMQKCDREKNKNSIEASQTS
jgi:hypothetical protein